MSISERLIAALVAFAPPQCAMAGEATHHPVRLTAGKVMGLMIAYCDNNRSELCENFVGSEITYEGKTDQGYIDAGLFGELVLDD